MGRRAYNWMIVFSMVGVFLAGPLAINALADGFLDKNIRIDGINSPGTLDAQNNLDFIGLGLWNGPFVLTFSPAVRTRYSLGATVETETGEIMGKYAVTFHLTPKSGEANYKNLMITAEDRGGVEVPTEIMMTSEDSGVAIEVSTTRQPQGFRISYADSKEKSGAN
jgi:hypothetical protein